MVVSHQPVMVDEVIEHLITIKNGIYVDGTVGTGGHSLEICKRIAPEGRLICLDVDDSTLKIAGDRLSPFEKTVRLFKKSYADLGSVLKDAGIGKVNGILLDLGMSSYQIWSSGRGFSFNKDEPLDMRMNRDLNITAADLVNDSSPQRLQQILWDYAQERWAKPISRAIVAERQEKPITLSRQLAQLIQATIPVKHQPKTIHPATKTFQALRIAVNGELNNIKDFLEKAPFLIEKEGRLVVIAYHSLEDRLIKQAFHRWEKNDDYPRKLPIFPGNKPPLMKNITKKGLRPHQAEIYSNPRSRSAVIRVAEKV